ncbi:DUF2812 domain-containing protein [Tissierella praeacuta]|uniref:DUF2812 domain-containing protein n=1 Tax=Tissierella praeacuta TaxID=43131 RepID=UPI00333ECE77
MSKMIRKILVGDLFYLQEHEEYFSEMSRKGLHLQKIGRIFAYFKEGQPKSLNYRIDVISDDKQERIIEKLKEEGWNFAGKKDSFLIFSSEEGSQLKELYETPEAQKLALSTARKEIFGEKALNIFSLICTIIIIILTVMMKLRDGLYFALAKGNEFYAFIIPLFSIYKSKEKKIRLGKIEKTLDTGEFLKHQGDYSLMKTKFIIRKIIFYFFIVAMIGILSHKISQNKKTNLSEIDDLESLPMITIADIEPMDYRRDRSRSFYKDDGIDYGNVIYQDWNLLIQKDNTLVESVVLIDKDQKRTEIEPMLREDYYLTRFDFIARGLEKDILAREKERYSLSLNVIEKENEFSCYGVEKENKKILLYRKGKQVIFLTYSNGTVSLEELIKVVAEKLG